MQTEDVINVSFTDKEIKAVSAALVGHTQYLSTMFKVLDNQVSVDIMKGVELKDSKASALREDVLELIESSTTAMEKLGTKLPDA